jgi:hypothetical protein
MAIPHIPDSFLAWSSFGIKSLMLTRINRYIKMNERQLHLKGEEEKRHNKDFESSTVKKAVINNKSVVDIQNNSCVAVYGCR